MDTNLLEEFLTLKNTGSYIKAAEELGITQSTLSRHIQAIEKEIGRQLISRNSHTFKLNSAGTAFSIYAQTVIEAQKNLMNDLENTASETTDSISVGLVHGSEMYDIADLLWSYHTIDPSVSFNVFTAPGSELVHMLRQNETDLIFIWDLDGPSVGQRSIHYRDDHYVLHVPYGHRLFGKEVIQLEDLRGEKLSIRCPKYSRTLIYIDQECRKLGFEPDLVPQPGYWVCAQDDSLYLSLENQIRRVRHAGKYSIADIRPQLTQRLMIRYKNNGQSPAASKFIHFLNEKL